MAELTSIYVAGPMTGLPGYNLAAFDEAATDLAQAGFDARNPGHRGVVDGHTWQDYMRDGLRMLLGCDAVAVLPGWEDSRGATLEVSVARALDMPVRPVADWLADGAR